MTRSAAPSTSTGRRLAGLALALCLLGPAPALAQEESHWYDGLVRAGSLSFDVAVMRPIAAVTLAVGSGLFVPAAVMTAPGGRETLEEAFELFILVPGKNLWEKPLGEF